MLFCEFRKISHKIFFKEPFARLLLHKNKFCLLSEHNLVPFQKRCHKYFSAEYFLGLICRLGTRMSSIFQTHSQKVIFNPIEHLLWSFFAKIGVSSLKLLSIFAKKSTVDVGLGSKYASVSKFCTLTINVSEV